MKKFFTTIILLFTILLSYSQTVWVKHTTPVLNRSALYPDWKGLATADPFVMVDNDTLKMWYSGSGWLSSTDSCPHVRMGYAWSLDGIAWNEYPGNPVLNINSDTSKFDADGIETPSVIKDMTAPVSQRYKLWYAGRKAQCSPVIDHKFGYAYSPDGIHWTKYSANPIMVAGNDTSWYNSFISNPSVIKDSLTYKMWFTAPDLVFNGQPTDGKGNIGYAASSDGISWNVFPSPVIIAGEEDNWDSASAAEPSVLKIGNIYHMFYSALNQWTNETFQVGYANSTDGIHWIKSISNPVLQIGAFPDWDRYWASHPAVMYDSVNTKFKMWYTGRDTANITSLTGYYWDIGYAESSFTSGIDVDNFLLDATLYPNPTSGFLTIRMPGVKQGVLVQVYSVLGQKIMETTSKTDLDISTIVPGVYILMIKQNNKKYITRIVKQ